MAVRIYPYDHTRFLIESILSFHTGKWTGEINVVHTWFNIAWSVFKRLTGMRTSINVQISICENLLVMRGINICTSNVVLLISLNVIAALWADVNGKVKSQRHNEKYGWTDAINVFTYTNQWQTLRLSQRPRCHAFFNFENMLWCAYSARRQIQ